MAKAKAAVKTEEKEVKEVVKNVGAGVEESKKDELAQAYEESKVTRHPGPWVKLTPKEVRFHVQNHSLFGHDPKKGEGILTKGAEPMPKDWKEEGDA